MKQASLYFRRSLIGLVVLLQIVFYPAAAMAEGEGGETAATDPTTTTQTTETQPTEPVDTRGPDSPPGAGGDTYHQNPDGTWSNDYYTWDPVTGETTSNAPAGSNYDPATGTWSGEQYVWDAPSGTYVPRTVYSSTPPAGVPYSGTDPSYTGPNSTNAVNQNTTNNGTFNNIFNAVANNNINSSATSGDARVIQNTVGGSALTGDAQSLVNILNMLQSSWDPAGGGPATFVANMNGDVNGDLLFDPALIHMTGPNSLNTIDDQTTNNLTTNTQINGTINNNVNLGATSGDAEVSRNTEAGDATSGDATAIANIINLINSSINSDKSFLGVVNINGDFNGDILLPSWLLSGMMDHTGPSSTNTIDQAVNNNVDVDLNTTTNINNNIDLLAQSGDAEVSRNTEAGSATTGSAQTNANIMNLTGEDVVGKNALLVFVNVHGNWLGMILDAPGQKSALMGKTGPNSINSIDQDVTNNLDINVDVTNTINNNITAHAITGDATVSRNTLAGNARSGDAYAAVNIANIVGSQINPSDWFGVLFINVFGDWLGSFGINTNAGNTPTTVAGAQTTATAPTTTTTSPASSAPAVVRFIPHDEPQTSSASTTAQPPATPTQNTPTPTKTASLAPTPSKNSFTWTFIGVTIALALLAIERYLTLRSNR